MSTLLVVSICTAGIVFLTRFFIAICREMRKSSFVCYLVSVRKLNDFPEPPPRAAVLAVGHSLEASVEFQSGARIAS
jgi:hypothetical protein